MYMAGVILNYTPEDMIVILGYIPRLQLHFRRLYPKLRGIYLSKVSKNKRKHQYLVSYTVLQG